MNAKLPSYADVLAAADRIGGLAVRTPLIESPALAARVGLPVWLKLESLQRGGAFKFRGALNRLSQLDGGQRQRGVVAWSSGNHAQGIAIAGKLLQVPVTVVMPSDAPRIKISSTRTLGAEVVLYDRYRESREDIARGIAMDRQGTLVPSFDDPDIIVGQGTVALEIAQQSQALGARLDVCLVPCGGGGLVAGCATAFTGCAAKMRTYAVEPHGLDDTARSLRSGRRETNASDARSICDALLAPTPGELTFAINQRLLAGGVVVTDAEVLCAVRFAAETLKLVVEPGGAVGLAALLAGKAPQAEQGIVVVISGGNMDGSTLASALQPVESKETA